tara:strand:+ start:106 stop:624 length:519 start_codon:yes stop_codon:yes gene_type:complete
MKSKKRKYVKRNTIKNVNKKTKRGKYSKKQIKTKRFRGGRYNKHIKEIVAEAEEEARAEEAAEAAAEAAAAARLNEAAIWANNINRIEATAAAQGRTLEPSLIARSYNYAPDANVGWYRTLWHLANAQEQKELSSAVARTMLRSVSSAHEHTDTPLLTTRRRSNRRPSTLSS